MDDEIHILLYVFVWQFDSVLIITGSSAPLYSDGMDNTSRTCSVWYDKRVGVCHGGFYIKL